jgi:hypothetical protein
MQNIKDAEHQEYNERKESKLNDNSTIRDLDAIIKLHHKASL